MPIDVAMTKLLTNRHMQIHEDNVKLCWWLWRVSKPHTDRAKNTRTDIAHGHADGLGAVCNDNTSTPQTDEQRLNDLRSDRVVLRQQTCHRPVVGIRGALQVYRRNG